MKDTNLSLIRGNSYMFEGDLTVGVYFNDTNRSAVLIDSGANKDVAKRIEQSIKQKDYQITSIIVTHGHQAQLGGVSYFKQKYKGLKVYATSWTTQFIEKRALEDWLSGHIPCITKETEHNQSPDLITDIVPYTDHTLVIDQVSFAVVPLPGHFPGMVGLITPDQVFYCGDAIFGKKTLNKQKLLYYTDIKGAKASLRKIGKRKTNGYVLSHGGVYTEVTDLIQQHLQLIDETSTFILGLVREQPMTLESIVQQVMKKYQLQNKSAHFTLANSIVRSYLTELSDNSKLRATVNDGRLHYYARSSAALI
ncbi:MBL fold metallo-hydrolase [Paenibacillus sp. 481]|uniref:MBL fold metallo-hydrolase n=1 Tax=Paenibacillus sp. 481 TaxID=2835869 RepID=UPI001E52A75C|nr:MBL fold metallo-hydrolase [Paenibacillus sp. 481]UHA72721.1 MBL fold metallo-hydrolase [Paenibacillus sp. 481]